jgi:hypothetical protein
VLPLLLEHGDESGLSRPRYPALEWFWVGCAKFSLITEKPMTLSAPSCQPRASIAGNTFPSIGRIARNISAGLALSLPLAVAWGQPAQAVLLYNFYESGSDLVIEASGSLNLSSISPTFSESFTGVSSGALDLDHGFLTGTFTTTLDFYDLVGPSSLGPGIIDTFALSSYDSGITTVLLYNTTCNGTPCGLLAIDPTYVSGNAIDSKSTFTDISLSLLGMPDSGTLATWTIGSGDTISVQVNASVSPASVPGPLPVLSLAAAFGFSRKLKKRIKRHREASSVTTSPGA